MVRSALDRYRYRLKLNLIRDFSVNRLLVQSIIVSTILFSSGCTSIADNKLTSEEQAADLSSNWLEQRDKNITTAGSRSFNYLLPTFDSFAGSANYKVPIKLQEAIKNENMANSAEELARQKNEGLDSKGWVAAQFSDPVLIANGPKKELGIAWVVTSFGGSWTRIDSIFLKVGSEIREFSPALETRRDASGNVYFEYISFLFDSKEDILFLSNIFTEGKIEARFNQNINGAVISDYQFSTNEIEAIKMILLAYRHIYQNDLLQSISTSK